MKTGAIRLIDGQPRPACRLHCGKGFYLLEPAPLEASRGHAAVLRAKKFNPRVQTSR